MKEKPILFSAPMVRAILDGSKTQTRRVMKFQPSESWLPHSYGEVHKMEDGEFPMKRGEPIVIGWGPSDCFGEEAYPCPHGQPSDRLWLREEHYRFGHWEPVPGVRTKGGRQKWKFVADSTECLYEAPESFRKGRHHKDPATPAWHKRLGRFMPRSLSRITLEIVSVRVERLQEISEEDAQAEGVERQAAFDDPDLKYQSYSGEDNGAGCGYFCERSYTNGFRNIWITINGPDSWTQNPWVWVINFKRINQ